MLERADISARQVASDWLDRFRSALATDDGAADLFAEDCHWRDLVALTGELRTTSGAGAVAGLCDALRAAGVADFRLHPEKLAPARETRAGVDVIEAVFTFETEAGTCEGLVRLLPDGSSARAWTILTALYELKGGVRRSAELAYARDVRAPNWLDNRKAALAYADRDPAVLVVGGGHAGLTIAAHLGQQGIDTLVVDREKRIGDNWRLRYHNLKLHNQINVNHLPYLPFPATFPRYIPKDMIANWLEFYTDAMEINFWTETSFEGANWDEEHHCWHARLTCADGSQRTMHPRHIVMAASTSAVPKLPDIPTLARFEGAKQHASEFTDGAPWRGRPVMVLGTGTSAHDIAQHLHSHGAQVTMVQRSPTMVVNVEPSAQLYDGLYLDPPGAGPAIEDLDLINASFPLALIKQAHKLVTDKVKEIDRETLEGLEAAGFRLEYGEDGTGWPLKYRVRGGGYYFNIGCSELIISGEIGLIQYHDIAAVTPGGVRMTNGTERAAELVVMATGYETQGHLVRQLFGDAIADRVGTVWGFNECQEMANMWTRTGQPGLWFTSGSFSQCRIYGRYLALQIALEERRFDQASTTGHP